MLPINESIERVEHSVVRRAREILLEDDDGLLVAVDGGNGAVLPEQFIEDLERCAQLHDTGS